MIKKYADCFYGVLFALLILNLWYLSSLLIEESPITKQYNYIIRFFTVLIGAFVGAIAAFKLKKYDDDKALDQTRINILHTATFVLIRQISATNQIIEKINKDEEEITSTFFIPAQTHPNYSYLKQEIQELTFLIGVGETAILLELAIQQEQFGLMIKSIENRNNLYMTEIQPQINKHRLNKDTTNQVELEEKLGRILCLNAIHNTKQMNRIITECHENGLSTLTKLQELTKKLYPNNDLFELHRNNKEMK
ncbi:MAG: hypothetical protein ACI88H_001373 [Cocleimonas sp.]|jgi:hypothetical protein